VAIHGHEKIIESLIRYLPPVALFQGPHSVGRWAVAEHIRWRYDVHVDDLLRVHALDMESVAVIQRFVLTSPAKGSFKLVIVELYRSSASAQVALASVLENLRHARVILIGQAFEVESRIRSLAVVYSFRYLSSAEVSAVLIDRMSFSPDKAKELGLRSNGQVARAIQIANAEDSLVRVRSALLALRTKDQAALSGLAKQWTDEDTKWLVQWCNESLSGQWRVFGSDDYIAGQSLPIRILLATKPSVRPRLVVRSQLMGLLKE
jgi:replication-associated recombination protein RarA